MVGGAVVVGMLASAGASAQTLALKPRPRAASLLCEAGPAERPATDGDPAELERLVNAATQAMILGDLDVAAEFLDQALEADPGAAEAVYLRGRITADRDGSEAAVPWFCRYLRLAPNGRSAAEARRRLEQAVEQGAGASLLAAFTGAVTRFETGELERADAILGALIAEHPIPEALYNRALVRLAQERPVEARADLARYLELEPDAGDRPEVEEAILTLEEGRPVRSPGAAFLVGALIPGGGQYYTGRTGFGALVTGVVGGAVAAGLLYERTIIRCRSPLPSGECPQDAIAGTETERPLLAPALGVGAGLMLVSAIEAALHARGRSAALSVPVGTDGRSSLDFAPPPVVSGGALDVRWIRFRH
jgi:tetratricopeptide (TPR) repeat protein